MGPLKQPGRLVIESGYYMSIFRKLFVSILLFFAVFAPISAQSIWDDPELMKNLEEPAEEPGEKPAEEAEAVTAEPTQPPAPTEPPPPPAPTVPAPSPAPTEPALPPAPVAPTVPEAPTAPVAPAPPPAPTEPPPSPAPTEPATPPAPAQPDTATQAQPSAVQEVPAAALPAPVSQPVTPASPAPVPGAPATSATPAPPSTPSTPSTPATSPATPPTETPKPTVTESTPETPATVVEKPAPAEEPKKKIDRAAILGPVKVTKVNTINEIAGSYKSPKTALFLSLAIPGAGQYYVGGSPWTIGRGVFYSLLEVGIISGWYYYSFYKYDQQVDKYEAYLEDHYSMGQYESKMEDLYNELDDENDQSEFILRYLGGRDQYCLSIYGETDQFSCNEFSDANLHRQNLTGGDLGQEIANLAGVADIEDLYRTLGGDEYVLGWDDVTDEADVPALNLEDDTRIVKLGSSDNQRQYQSYRKEANDLAGMQTVFLGALIVNHLVSALDAALTARAHNRKLYQQDVPGGGGPAGAGGGPASPGAGSDGGPDGSTSDGGPNIQSSNSTGMMSTLSTMRIRSFVRPYQGRWIPGVQASWSF